MCEFMLTPSFGAEILKGWWEGCNTLSHKTILDSDIKKKIIKRKKEKEGKEGFGEIL